MTLQDVALASAAAQHRRVEARRRTALLAMGAAVLVSVIADVATGPAMLAPRDVVATLVQPMASDDTLFAIVWGLRLPMAIMAVIVGLALGTSGATMQTLLDNPLASPYTLGLAAAAGLGASLAIQFGSFGLDPLVAIPLCAFVMALTAAAAIFGIGSRRGMAGNTVILAGIAMMFLFNSGQSIVQFRASPEIGQQIVFWMFGSLAKATWTNVTIVALACAAAIPLLVAKAWPMTAVRLGEERARALGVDVRRLRVLAVTLVSLLTATAISFVGTIGFVGLVSPHIARMLVGEDQRFLLPLAGLVGALVLSVASVVSKIVMPGVLVPVGIVTSVIGVPFFLHLILARPRMEP